MSSRPIRAYSPAARECSSISERRIALTSSSFELSPRDVGGADTGRRASDVLGALHLGRGDRDSPRVVQGSESRTQRCDRLGVPSLEGRGQITAKAGADPGLTHPVRDPTTGRGRVRSEGDAEGAFGAAIGQPRNAASIAFGSMLAPSYSHHVSMPMSARPREVAAASTGTIGFVVLSGNRASKIATRVPSIL